MSEYSIPPNGQMSIGLLEFSNESDDDRSNNYIVKGSLSASLEWADECGTWSGPDDYDQPISKVDMAIIQKVIDQAEADGLY